MSYSDKGKSEGQPSQDREAAAGVHDVASSASCAEIVQAV